jgi:hypothetical protein
MMEDNIIKDVKRIDTFNCDSSFTKTDEGYLIFDAPVAKVGVYEYVLSDGSIQRDFIGPEQLFAQDSMDTIKLKPVTNSHPPEVFVNASLNKSRKIGGVGETVKRKNDMLYAKMVIDTDDGIKSILNENRRQLSPGYTCDLIKSPGTYKGQSYDVVQVNRRYNHVAIVDSARGGSDLSIKIDSIDNVNKNDGISKDIVNIDLEIKQETNNEGGYMPTIRIDGKDYEASSEVITNIGRLEERILQSEKKCDGIQGNVNELTIKLDEKTKENSKLQAEKDTLQAKLDEAKSIDINAIVNQKVAERVEVEKVASLVSKEIKVDEMEIIDAKKAIILKKYPEAKLDGKDEIYINARFDAVKEGLSEVSKIDEQNALTNPKFVNVKNDSLKAEEKYLEESKNAWRKK